MSITYPFPYKPIRRISFRFKESEFGYTAKHKEGYEIHVGCNGDYWWWDVEHNGSIIAERDQQYYKKDAPTKQIAIKRAVIQLNKWRKEKSLPRKAMIYVLINPFNNKVFYVGSTKITLEQTLARHMSTRGERGVNAAKRAVIKKIVNRGRKPIIKCVQKCDATTQFRHERRWIWKYCPRITNKAI